MQLIVFKRKQYNTNIQNWQT